jgi:hypothetical protein
MANTVIQLKYSNITNKPPLLNVAEPAYSNVSGTLWIDDGTAVVAIGGKAYTDKIDAAASIATANVLVKRDTTGNVAFHYVFANVIGRLEGNASSASKWFTSRVIGVDGDATGVVSVDGTANANIPLVLTNTTVTPGTYGGSDQAAVVTVDSKGRVTYAANVAISSTLNFAGDAGASPGSLSLINDTLTIKGGPSGGIDTVAVDANNTVLLAVNNTVLRNSGNQFISGDLTLTGSLFVAGNTTTVNTTTISTSDSLIRLAANNTVSDVLDIGFYGVANTGTSNTHHGLIRRAGGDFFLFKGLTSDPTSNVLAAGSVTASNTATIRANLTGGMISGLANTINVVDGGTGVGTFTVGSILVGDGTNSLKVLANTGTAGAYGSASNTLIVTTDSYGRVSAVTNSAIQIDASNIVSGKLAIARGGTNNDTYTTGAALFYDGTAISTLANTCTAGTYGSASYLPVITTDAYGRVSGVSNTAVNIDTSAIVSGTLGVARGGTGASSFTVKGVIISDPSSTTGALSALTSPTEGHVLQINSSGAPTFAHLNGGTF